MLTEYTGVLIPSDKKLVHYNEIAAEYILGYHDTYKLFLMNKETIEQDLEILNFKPTALEIHNIN
jgi:hypothetical protein